MRSLQSKIVARIPQRSESVGGELSMESRERRDLPVRICLPGRQRRLTGAKPATEGERQGPGGSKGGAWVYTGLKPGGQNGIPGVIATQSNWERSSQCAERPSLGHKENSDSRTNSELSRVADVDSP